jgi:hypothetical protein
VGDVTVIADTTYSFGEWGVIGVLAILLAAAVGAGYIAFEQTESSAFAGVVGVAVAVGAFVLFSSAQEPQPKSGDGADEVATYLYVTAGIKADCSGIGNPDDTEHLTTGDNTVRFEWFKCTITHVPARNPLGFTVGQDLDMSDPLAGT